MDLGGGSLDVSILQVSDGLYEVLSTAGLALGGVDFDACLARWITSELESQSGVELREDVHVSAINEEAEQVKMRLSHFEETQIQLPNLVPNRKLKLEVTRKHFESISKTLLDRVSAACSDALQKAKLDVTQIQSLVLVGGMSRVPAVRHTVEQVFQQKIVESTYVNPDGAVACGAAV